MSKKNLFSPKNRRGLSSVVGALFFTVLMIAGFSVLSLALDAQTDIVTTQRIVSDIEIKKQQETFSVFASTDANDILNVSINNQGQNPVEITSVWITNKTLSDEPVKRFTINYDDAFVPPGFVSNVVSTQTLEMIPDTYDIKVVSTFGTIKTVEMDNNGGSTSDLRVELFTDPPDPVIGKNVTVALMVTNTGLVDTINNVQPYNFDFTAPGGVVVTPDPLLDPPSTPVSANLNPGASVMFTWDFQVSGDSGDELTFSSAATGDGLGSSNTASDISRLRIAGEGGGSPDPDIVNSDLLARPQLFFIIPSSQGEADTTDALWGINVVNPVNAPMEVTKLIITAFAPGAQNNNKIFNYQGNNCSPDPIFPATGTWSCPSENALMWKSSTPITIPANSTQAFLTQVEPGKPSGNTGLESVTVQGSVFTSLGSFGKAGYQTTMSETSTSMVSVYLTTNTADPRNDNFIQTTMTGILPNEVRTFNVVFADMDDENNTLISSSPIPAKLIINVPKDWTEVTVITDDGFSGTPSVTQFGDSSHQIVGEISADLGSDLNSADYITFTARAPNLSVGSDELHVMYILAQGDTTNGFSIGPLAEVVLQVDG